MFRRWSVRLGLAGGLLAVGLGFALAQASQPVRVRGTVASLSEPKLMIRSREGGEVSIDLAGNWTAIGVVKATIEDIKPGTFVGAAALPSPGDELRAVEVLIFPEAMRGVGEGHYPWDLLPESSMTNATVTSVVEGVNGRTLKLTYTGGERSIIVPPEAPIVTFSAAEKSDVTPSAAVFVPAQRQADGTLQTTRVLVGKDGVVPPM